mgnify:FL=1
MAVRRRKQKASLLLRISVICFVTYVAVTLVNMQLDVTAKRRELILLQQSVEQQKLENKETERMLQMGENREYIERIARDKLEFAYPDEKIIIDVSGK